MKRGRVWHREQVQPLQTAAVAGRQCTAVRASQIHADAADRSTFSIPEQAVFVIVSFRQDITSNTPNIAHDNMNNFDRHRARSQASPSTPSSPTLLRTGKILSTAQFAGGTRHSRNNTAKHGHGGHRQYLPQLSDSVGWTTFCRSFSAHVSLPTIIQATALS